jgi:putative transposase
MTGRIAGDAADGEVGASCRLPFIESFNGKLRAECLNAHWFMSLDDAQRKCEAWRRDYNEERPHSSIGNKAPIELVNRSAALGPP